MALQNKILERRKIRERESSTSSWFLSVALCVAGGTPSRHYRLEGDVQGASELACE